jgi:lipoprotein-releasing system permease protein
VRLPFRLARRYVFQPRSRKLVHVISGISMFVIAAVTMAMIAILSAFNGIEDLVQDLFGTLDADLAAVAISGEVLPNELGEKIGSHPGVAHYSAVIESEAVIRGGGTTHICSVLGVDSNYGEVTGINGAIVEGVWGKSFANEACICLGYGIRSEMGFRSDSIDPPLMSLGAPIRGKKLRRHKESDFRTVPALACGTFSINADLDTRYVLAPLELTRELFDRPNEVSRFEIRVAEGWSAEALATDEEFLNILGDNVFLRTRAEKHKFITQTNRAEKWATFVILSFILIVAAFNILASLTMLLIDKRQDLEVFKALGMKSRDLERTFSIQGLAINILGGVFGAILGIAIVLGQNQFGWLALEGSVVPYYPVRLSAVDIFGTLAVVVGIGGLGSAAMVRFLIRRLTTL